MRRRAIVASVGAVLVSVSAWADPLAVVKPEVVGLSAARLERLAATIRQHVDTSRLDEFAVEHMESFRFGLGVAVRTRTGVAGVPGAPGEFLWSGAQGTMFWVDPKEQLSLVFLANTPGMARRHYRQLVKYLVLQALVE